MIPYQKKVSWAARRLATHASLIPEEKGLPWRKRPTPYHVFLSEFLLVRTRADVVARVFVTLREKYPNFKRLATATEEDLGAILRPLGLRQRTSLLLRAAKYIVEKEDGRLPRTIQKLKLIPGIGDYTACAVVAFAFENPEVPSDVNILRFVSRLTGLPMEHRTKGSRNLKALVPLLSYEQGGPNLRILLDFTRLICRPRKPQCHKCPLTQKCSFFNSFVED